MALRHIPRIIRFCHMFLGAKLPKAPCGYSSATIVLELCV